jgi:hypothetical protein
MALAPNADSLVVMRLMSCILVKVGVQWSFQLGQVCLKEGLLLGCRIVLHFVQGRRQGPGVVPGGLLVSPRAGDSHKVGGEFA